MRPAHDRRDGQPDIVFAGDEERRHLSQCLGSVRFLTRMIADELMSMHGPDLPIILHYQQRRRWCFLEARRMRAVIAAR